MFYIGSPDLGLLFLPHHPVQNREKKGQQTMRMHQMRQLWALTQSIENNSNSAYPIYYSTRPGVIEIHSPLVTNLLNKAFEGFG